MQYLVKRFHGHKFKRSGFRYEVAIGIETGDIVWIHGPFPCGANPDIVIFRKALKAKLQQAREKCIADLGYRGEPQLINTPNPYDSAAMKRLKKDAAMRHETANKHFKEFNVLGSTFRHELEFHKPCFEACAVLTQMAIIQGEPLYQTQYGHLPMQNWRARRVRG